MAVFRGGKRLGPFDIRLGFLEIKV